MLSIEGSQQMLDKLQKCPSLSDGEMTQSINIFLAKAIGWNDAEISLCENGVQVLHCGHWKIFDYRDSATIWPIACKFDAFPLRQGVNWIAFSESGDRSGRCDTPNLAVAIAVIRRLGNVNPLKIERQSVYTLSRRAA